MENTIEINEVDLGDDTLIADPTHGSGVAASTECTPNEPVVVESESGDGARVVSVFVFGAGARDRAVSMSGAGCEGGSAAF